MPKLDRVTAKVFASNAPADEIGQFGSALTGTKVLTGDIEEIQSLPAYLNGWGSAVLTNRNYPTMQEFNGLLKVMSYQTAYQMQEGISEYDANTTYYTGSIVKTIGGNGKAKLYQSIKDVNTGNPLTDMNYWEDFNPLMHQITNCILEAPNGVATYTSTSITVKQGLKVLFANGRNADGTFKNIEYTLPEDYTLTIGTLVDSNRTVCLVYDVNSDTVGLWIDKSDKFYIGSAYPSSITLDTNSCLYNPYTNVYSHYNGSAWVDYPAVYLGNIRTSNNTYTNAGFTNPVDILKRTDKFEISGWGMPSNKIVTLTLGASGTEYVAPADGYFFILKRGLNVGEWISSNITDSNGNGVFSVLDAGVSQRIQIKQFFPIGKGYKAAIYYTASGAEQVFQFIYAQGSESEAI